MFTGAALAAFMGFWLGTCASQISDSKPGIEKPNNTPKLTCANPKIKREAIYYLELPSGEKGMAIVTSPSNVEYRAGELQILYSVGQRGIEVKVMNDGYEVRDQSIIENSRKKYESVMKAIGSEQLKIFLRDRD